MSLVIVQYIINFNDKSKNFEKNLENQKIRLFKCLLYNPPSSISRRTFQIPNGFYVKTICKHITELFYNLLFHFQTRKGEFYIVEQTQNTEASMSWSLILRLAVNCHHSMKGKHTIILVSFRPDVFLEICALKISKKVRQTFK